ncbi:DUF58 domain-containing protein [Calidifontibacter sp. DB0510]|uniref:DUF58 domain-containing protein n=1 Tax=Metallococcus carri TaxID=1656884 RepID=A0A967EA46_9MICO|nr:DUF58 domain-containing protein [Metallococcus carri]NHN55890.1 DUF58 domain-containing protein [Metallococcus carri]NOP38422.1 DUF58 domain-containing protein [Calidifontibacter sp. DB2511S]
MAQPDPPAGWVPGPTFLAGSTAAAGLILLAVMTRRPDLFVLVLPLLGVTVWSLLTRPTGIPQARTAIAQDAPEESSAVAWTASLTGARGAEQWHVVVATSERVTWDDQRRSVTRLLDGDADTSSLTFALQRWGPATIGASEVVATSPWAGFVWGPVHLPGQEVRGVPRTDPFSGRAPVPHPVGLVGPNRSRRFGEGAEFADIRPFRPGDKLRTIHWPVTSRTGQLHVRTSYAEQDAQVHLVLDASVDVGGRDDSATSLDLGLRACASLSQYFLRRGDRVGLDVIGAVGRPQVPLSLGDRQHRRVLDVLSQVRVGRLTDRQPDRVRLHAGPGAMVFLISPLMGDFAAKVAADLARRGLAVVVIDCLPADPASLAGDAWDAVALRIRMLERSVEIDELGTHGIPVNPWRGPGSLDAVLQVLARRPPARMRAR